MEENQFMKSTGWSQEIILEIIKDSWGWTGIEPIEIVGENAFGNLIIKDAYNKYWRLCPEDIYCKVVAQNRPELDSLSIDEEFMTDWYMDSLVEMANEKLGPLQEGRKYCLKVPGVLGGEYSGDNLATISLEELIRFSGDLAHQIKDLPDGAQVKLNVTE